MKNHRIEKGFTLVELLVVVIVLVTLMSLIFSLGSIASDSERRNVTVARMQRIENCISGYYAAFGSYPSVQLHGSRNIFYKVNRYGIQQTRNNELDEGTIKWERVEAACRSQPVGMNYPFASSMENYIKSVATSLMELHNNDSPDTSEYAKNPMLANMTGNFQPGWIEQERRGKAKWEECQVFRFGLMSFLLPRFVVMMGNDNYQIYNDFAQWKDNNELPCRFEDGSRYSSWQELNQDVIESDGVKNSRAWKVEALPSQAVTARWMPNLEQTLNCERPLKLYGVQVSIPNDSKWSWVNFGVGNPWPVIYTGGDSQGGEGTGDASTQYVLNGVTCRDGWNNEYYYFSDAPYQSYRFWSAGPNGKTFPPWISEEEITGDPTMNRYRKQIQNWMADDIVHMSN